jgi:hypothetical protein
MVTATRTRRPRPGPGGVTSHHDGTPAAVVTGTVTVTVGHGHVSDRDSRAGDSDVGHLARDSDSEPASGPAAGPGSLPVIQCRARLSPAGGPAGRLPVPGPTLNASECPCLHGGRRLAQ